MYTLNLPVSTLRTKVRQEFERHRYVNQLKTVDVLLFNSHQEFQVRVHPAEIVLALFPLRACYIFVPIPNQMSL